MEKMQIGVILLREECIFRREILQGDPVTISFELSQARRNYSRWSFRHKIMKNPETIAALLTVDGAWLDLRTRKLAVPPKEMVPVFEELEMAEDFKWLD